MKQASVAPRLSLASLVSVASLASLAVMTSALTAHAQTKPAADTRATPASSDARPDDAASDDAPGAPTSADDATTAPAPSAGGGVVTGTPSGSFTPLPAWPEPGNDAAELRRQGGERPKEVVRSGEHEVFAEDWWTHARPLLELHGYFRVRAELFYQFALGRKDLPVDSSPSSPFDAIWPQPADNRYRAVNGDSIGPALCTPDETGNGSSKAATNARFDCKGGTQAGANLRFRLDPELHISDNLRVISQIDLLDNVQLGSTPGGYVNVPADSGNAYAVAARGGYTPISFNTTTTTEPRSGVNSWKDSVAVKRVWGEFATPVGELRFGRMPNHWGLGIFNNAGDGYDDNYQSTVDRIQFTTGLKPLDLYVTGAWDYVAEGPNSDTVGIAQGQAYDLAQSDDVTEYMLAVTRKKSRELTRLALAKGGVVVNGGVQVYYRNQRLADDSSLDPTTTGGTCATGAAALGCQPGQIKFSRRGGSSWTPDVWLQLLYKKFRFEMEALTIQGSFDNVSTLNDQPVPDNRGYKLRQWGFASEIAQQLVEDKLRLGFNFGWASGDSDVDGLSPPYNRAPSQHGDRTDSTYRFNPAYTIDLILYRNILTRVQGTYYFRPSISYDFLRDNSGQKLGGGFAAIWSRASEFFQAPGHKRDLGIELNANVYFQSKDGALNDDLSKRGGFFTKLEYGVLFPMSGLGYTDNQKNNIANQLGPNATGLNTAQTVRWYIGAFF